MEKNPSEIINSKINSIFEEAKDWVKNVATSGVFTKAASMTSWTTGTSGIPVGWSV